MTVCEQCGKAITSATANKKYCSNRCKTRARRERERAKSATMQEAKNIGGFDRPDAEQAIIDVNTRALREGMTYGQYVAQKYCKGMGTRHFERRNQP